jgi:mRNA interferase MazF
LATEVEVGPEQGLDHPCVISLDNLAKIDRSKLIRYVGTLDADSLNAVYEALHVVFDLPY